MNGTKRIAAGQSEQDAGDASAERQQQAFCEQLANQTKARAAEGGADSHFALPRGCAHEQEISDVDAGEDQDKSGKDEE